MLPREGDTLAFLAGRERVLGDRLRVNRDPELAAADLLELLGGRAIAYQWALDLLAALGDRGRAA